MHLTPFSRRPSACALTALALVVSACGGPRLTPAPAPVAPPPAIDSTRPVDVAAWRLEPSSQRYTIAVRTQSQELSDAARVDSTRRESDFLATLTQQPSARYVLELRAPRVANDPATAGRRLRNPGDTVVTIRLSLDATATRADLDPAARDSCASEGSLLSPLLARLLIVPPATAQRTTAPVDSLHYVTCAAGSRLENRVSIRQLSDDTIAGGGTFEIAGQLRADSTRALPMHLQGTIAGRAIVRRASATTSFADSIELTVDVQLTASSSLKQQRFQQRVSTVVRPR